MEKGIIIAGGGSRGMMFARMLACDLRRPVAAIAENNKAAHPAIRRRLKEWGIPDVGLYDSLAQALAAIPRSRADTVFVMTPDWTHLEVARVAIPAGCHVFLEKPLATTPKDVLEIVRLAHATDKTVQVGFVLRYSIFIRKIKEIVDSGALGRLVMIQLNERLGLMHGASFCRSWHRKVRYTGGFLNEKCSHDLDLLCWFKEGQSAPQEVFSHGGRHFTPRKNTPATCDRCRLRNCPWRQKTEQCVFHSDGDVMDHQSVNVLFADGTQGQFTVAAMSPVPGRDVRIFGTDGYLEGAMEEGVLRMKHYWEPAGLKDVSVAASGGHGGGDTRIVAEFLDCIDRHEQPLSSVLDGARASLLAFAADKSVKTHKAIPCSGIMRRLSAEQQRHETVKGRMSPLTGHGFDSNLVIKGACSRAGFDCMIGNPTGWPVNVSLRFNSAVVKFLQDCSLNVRLPVQKGALLLTLNAHERKNFRLPGRSGKLLGATASVAPDKADDLKRFVSEKMALYRKIEVMDDENLKKLLSYLQFDKPTRVLREEVRILMAAGRKGDGLAIANLTGGYAMMQLENCLRRIPMDGAHEVRLPAQFYIACGSAESFKDATGRLWLAAQPWMEGLMPWGYIGGARSADLPPARIQGTQNQRLYQNDWHCLSGFRFRVPSGDYTIRLHFAETWYDQIGQRRFDVQIQGQPVLKALDVFSETGGKYRALVKVFTASVKDGMLAIDFFPAKDAPTHAPMINGIEVVESGKGAAKTCGRAGIVKPMRPC